MKLLAALTLLLFSLGAQATILPPNNLHLRPRLVGIAETGLTRAQFDNVMDKITLEFSGDFAARGGTFVILRSWEDEHINAQAFREGANWYIEMFGGLARYPGMTEDAMMMVACHETGHQIGGAPKYDDSDWASDEGQADYFAAVKCMKRVFARDMVQPTNVDPVVKEKCVNSDLQEQSLCERISTAGYVLARVLADVQKIKTIAFNTPDPTVRQRTYHMHPNAQCRLDTYFRGALCKASALSPTSDSDPRVGYCFGQDMGARPLCWFNPEFY